MAMGAVLFDLYGTLAPGGTRELRDGVSCEVAADLGVDPDAFGRAVGETFLERSLGALGSLDETLRELATRLGATPSDEAIAQAASRRCEMTRRLIDATWALDVLDELRGLGVPTALVSDCSAETAIVWPDTALSARFDAWAFSCEHGVKKPDPALYLAVTTVLGVDPVDCLYVGDGGSTELPGAAALGMRAVWLDHPGNQGGTSGVEWKGERIRELHELPGLVRAAMVTR